MVNHKMQQVLAHPFFRREFDPALPHNIPNTQNTVTQFDAQVGLGEMKLLHV